MSMKYSDVVVGAAGTVGTFSLAQLNVWLGTGCGLVTFIVLLFKLRREWLFRNVRPAKRPEREAGPDGEAD